MAYEKQTWQTGDVVTAAKLNHMEDGISTADKVCVFHVEQTGETTFVVASSMTKEEAVNYFYYEEEMDGVIVHIPKPNASIIIDFSPYGMFTPNLIQISSWEDGEDMDIDCQAINISSGDRIMGVIYLSSTNMEEFGVTVTRYNLTATT